VKRILEVIACSVEDAIEAERGGAARLEIVRERERGGLTPPLDLVRAIRRAVALPLRVMVRESDGFGCAGEAEIRLLRGAARAFEDLAVDGLVTGFAIDGRLDVETTRRVLAAAPATRATFHHAFDAAADTAQALRDLSSLTQVDRILSAGGAGWASLQERAAPRIVIAGGGMTHDVVREIAASTPILEFHTGSAVRRDGVVCAELVRSMVEAIS
jgi:copper homeostasis protein